MIAHLDCSTGVSGDKFLGALLDAGSATGAFTEDDLANLVRSLAPEAHVSVERVRSHGLAAVGLHVSADGQPHSRTWRDIRALLGEAHLAEPVRDRALAVFAALAQAEAKAHGCDADDVHFHEVGALDSIADIVGVAAGLHALGIDELVVSPVAVGGGTVETSHGTLPVPAPATAALLVGVPVVPGPLRADGSVAGELTTPTGAALVATLATGFGPCPPLTPRAIGYGAGTRDIGSPNVCRLLLGDAPAPAPVLSADEVVLLETNVDHICPEEVAFVAETLLAEGALDVWQTPIVMKKGRAAVLLSALVAPEALDATAERIVALTGSLGVRTTRLERRCADREVRLVESPWGPARVKVGASRLRAEHDDVARIASEHALPYGSVAAAIEDAARESAGFSAGS